MEASLTIIYTGNLRGDLALLPRLYSFIKQLRAHYSEEAVTLCPDDPAPANLTGKILLLDLGDSCAPDVWHCAVTGGRSTLVVLDSMGYDAANVSGFLAPDARNKLGDMMRIALVDDEYEWWSEHILVHARRGDPPGRPYILGTRDTTQQVPSLHNMEKGTGGEVKLTIHLNPASDTHLERSILSLARVEAGQIGVARICTKKTPYELEEHTIFDLPRQTQPDPTIAGMVDFVISEAKHTQKKQQT